jgi:hypothetical protein
MFSLYFNSVNIYVYEGSVHIHIALNFRHFSTDFQTSLWPTVI